MPPELTRFSKCWQSCWKGKEYTVLSTQYSVQLSRTVMPKPVPRYLLLAILLATLAGQGGCAWLHGMYAPRDPPPQVLQPGAGLEQVIAAVNRNNSQIQSLYSDSAMLSSPRTPTLHAHFAYQRPQFFRLRADGIIGSGSEVDLGSNAEWFWFWVKRSEPPAIYYCRHEQFATSRARAMIPIEPSWLIEALGTLEIDPNGHHDGPYPDPNNRNRIWIRTLVDTPEGPNKKITFIDPVSAWVLEQQVYDAQRPAACEVGGRRLPPRCEDGALCSDGGAGGMSGLRQFLYANRPGRRAGQPTVARCGLAVVDAVDPRLSADRSRQPQCVSRPVSDRGEKIELTAL